VGVKDVQACLGDDMVIDYVFFFSSRRRHTRFSRDWSSDVCSSDLNSLGPWALDCGPRTPVTMNCACGKRSPSMERNGMPPPPPKIGRASCRERGEMSGHERA